MDESQSHDGCMRVGHMMVLAAAHYVHHRHILKQRIVANLEADAWQNQNGNSRRRVCFQTHILSTEFSTLLLVSILHTTLAYIHPCMYVHIQYTYQCTHTYRVDGGSELLSHLDCIIKFKIAVVHQTQAASGSCPVSTCQTMHQHTLACACMHTHTGINVKLDTKHASQACERT